MHYGVKPARN